MIRILITGPARAGKTNLAQEINKVLEERGTQILTGYHKGAPITIIDARYPRAHADACFETAEALGSAVTVFVANNFP